DGMPFGRWRLIIFKRYCNQGKFHPWALVINHRRNGRFPLLRHFDFSLWFHL
ncbi:unnamed protein product, partial [Nesidiocoris tenuis]